MGGGGGLLRFYRQHLCAKIWNFYNEIVPTFNSATPPPPHSKKQARNTNQNKQRVNAHSCEALNAKISSPSKNVSREGNAAQVPISTPPPQHRHSIAPLRAIDLMVMIMIGNDKRLQKKKKKRARIRADRDRRATHNPT